MYAYVRLVDLDIEALKDLNMRISEVLLVILPSNSFMLKSPDPHFMLSGIFPRNFIMSAFINSRNLNMGVSKNRGTPKMDGL